MMLIEAPLYRISAECKPQAPTKIRQYNTEAPGCDILAMKGKHIQYKADEKLPFVSVGESRVGTFGRVDKVRSRLSANAVFARKCFFRWSDKYRTKQFEEIRLLSQLRHPHIVEIIGSYQKGKELGFLMVPFADTDLKTFLRSESPSKPTLKQGLGCLIAGLAFLHQEKILHGDIKPGNILLHDHRFLFTDFGCSKDIQGLEKSATEATDQGTREYAAPEIIERAPRGRPADVFSLGCVLMEIFSVLEDYGSRLEDYGSRPETPTSFVALQHYADHLASMEKWIEERRAKHDSPITRMWLDTCSKMLRAEPKHRPRATELCSMGTGRLEQGRKDEIFCPRCIHQMSRLELFSGQESAGAEGIDADMSRIHEDSYPPSQVRYLWDETDAEEQSIGDGTTENTTIRVKSYITARLLRASLDAGIGFAWQQILNFVGTKLVASQSTLPKSPLRSSADINMSPPPPQPLFAPDLQAKLLLSLLSPRRPRILRKLPNVG
ncbi:kinase-like protein [Lentithecium fluviatile CBS 122367]|uniref:non-specific serine/threonine protein kinase n=1 Tax=Lentithecium fluviatile CBS 122367 TaxID=1168545 RepID=A0A6G1JAF1_9PLEO|nr:kinase-like protein [Lentithecium fluviatile CBS 122367]